MDLINGIINVLTPMHLFYSFLGCVLGTLVGVLAWVGSGLDLVNPSALNHVHGSNRIDHHAGRALLWSACTEVRRRASWSIFPEKPLPCPHALMGFR